MSRRIPLWATLVPLVLAIAGYWLVWSNWAKDFGAVVERVLPASKVSVTGFPYRLETALAKPVWTFGDGVKMVASADRALVNRGPWHDELTVIRAEYPKVSAIVGPGFGASFTGKSALTSVRIEDGKLARLSSIIEMAKARLGFSETEEIMAVFDDDDRPKKKIAHEIGQDLGLLSVEELKLRVQLLHDEIKRLEADMAKKHEKRAAADQFFKR